MAASNADVLSSNSNVSSTVGSGSATGVVVSGAVSVVVVFVVVVPELLLVRIVIVGTRAAALFARFTDVRCVTADIASPQDNMAQNAKIIGVPMRKTGLKIFILCVICR